MKKIIIDPGHGGNGRLTRFGASGNGLLEKELNLEYAMEIAKVLEENFYVDVELTRTGDYDVSWTDRAAFGRGADLLYSVHFNGFHDPRANGFETFIWNGNVRPETKRNQDIIHNAIYSYLYGYDIRDRGMKRANFAILRMPPCSCVLAEYGFITNPREATIFKQPQTRELVALETATGIAVATNLPAKPLKPQPKKLKEILENIRTQLDEAIALA